MTTGTVRVRGLKELQRTLKQADKETRKRVRDVLRETGEIVRTEAQSRFSDIDVGSASGFKVRVRQRGVSVEQTRRKTTGKRGDYGALQMTRALNPALKDKEDEVVRSFEEALEKITHIVKGA